MTNGTTSIITILLLSLIIPSQGNAGLWSLFGTGAQNQSMGNATVALPTDAFAQTYNPALMADQEQKILTLGFMGAITNFVSINQVIVDSPSLGASGYIVGNIDTHNPDTFAFVLGYQAPLSKKERPIHLGLHLTSPVERLMLIESQDAYQPQYAMYLSDSQKLTVGLSLAKELSDHWSIGLGANLYLVQAANARTRLPAGGNSTALMKMEIKPAVAPNAGVTYEHRNEESQAKWRYALSYRGQQDYRSKFDFNNTINIISNPSDLILNGKSSLYFDPDFFILGASRSDEKDSYVVSAQWERWSAFRGTMMVMTYQTYTGSFNQVLPPTQYHDVISLHGGYEHKWGQHSGRIGYSFVPTPVPDQSGESNILDSDKHEISLGYGYKWTDTFIESPIQLDVVGFSQILMPKKVTKVSSIFIGAPGYTIGGAIYGWGVNATMEFQ